MQGSDGRVAGSAGDIRSRLRLLGPLIIVLLAFAAAAFVVPTLTPVATTDDWGYSRSVEILHHDGRLTVFPAVAATAVFQIAWGFVVTFLFGMTLGIVRVSTLIMVAASGVALYGTLRQLGVAPGRGALGVAAYLFNPLTFVLAYTFMTDPFLTSLLVIATYWYVRGLAPSDPKPSAVVIGSAVAACAFLTRQQGALIPAGVVSYLLVTGRLRPDRAGIALFLRVTAIPLLATLAYYAWLRWYNDVPQVQEGFFNEARRYGLSGAGRLARNLAFIELMYAAFFVLPLTAALVPSLRRVIPAIRWPGWLLACGALCGLVLGLALYGPRGRLFPYIGQFVGSGGLGAPDVRGSRPRLFDRNDFELATVVCAFSAVIMVVVLARAIGAAATPERSAAGLVAAIGVWQLVGVLPPSFHYLNRGYSLDRYLLPLVPIAICLLLWAARDLPLVRPVGWVVVAVFAVVSVAGTRDYLVYMDAVWDIAATAHANGVPYDQIDAGAAWDGYHLYTYGLENGITRARTRDGPWWMGFYGLASDSSYIVTSRRERGYATVGTRTYSSWLLPEDGVLYLQVRAGLPRPSWSI